MARRPRKYRLWTAEEKRSICVQTRPAGVSVAQVARRYSMNANLIFKWLKEWCSENFAEWRSQNFGEWRSGNFPEQLRRLRSLKISEQPGVLRRLNGGR